MITGTLALPQFFADYPIALIPILLIGAALVGAILATLAGWHAQQPGPVASAVVDWLIDLSKDALEKIDEQLGNLTPELRSERITEIAKILYAMVPPYVYLKLRTQVVVVPIRWLVSEELFVQIIQALAAGAADQIEVLRKQIEDRYRSYQADPTQVAQEYARVMAAK